MAVYLSEPADRNIKELVGASLGVSVPSYSDAVLVLAYLSGSVSYEELYSIFGELPSIFRAKVIPKLVQDGLLRKHNFARPDGTSICCFICTPKGAIKARELCGICQKGPSRVKSAVSPHSYAVGYNLYQLIKGETRFKWYRESPYDNPEKIGLDYRRGSDLRTDCTAVYDSGRVLRIEEDRCNENISVLSDKIDNYSVCGCFDNPYDVLVFSIRTAGVSVPEYPGLDPEYIYSPTKCKNLIKCMEEQQVEDASFLTGHRELFKPQGYLKKLLSRITEFYGERTVNVAFLKELYKVLNSGICPMQQEDFNKTHMQSSGNILRYAASVIAGGGPYNKTCLHLFEGRAVGFIATSLLSLYLPYLMLSENSYEKAVVSVFIEKYFGEAFFTDELSDALRIGEYSNVLMLRNSFKCSYGSVCVEFPSVDMGAWVRCKTFTEHMRDIKEPLQVICVFNTEKDAKDFFVFTGYDAASLSVTRDRPSLYGVLFSEMERGGQMFVASGDADDRYFFPVLP